jgi:hypothetical protein
MALEMALDAASFQGFFVEHRSTHQLGQIR